MVAVGLGVESSERGGLDEVPSRSVVGRFGDGLVVDLTGGLSRRTAPADPPQATLKRGHRDTRPRTSRHTVVSAPARRAFGRAALGTGRSTIDQAPSCPKRRLRHEGAGSFRRTLPCILCHVSFLSSASSAYTVESRRTVMTKRQRSAMFGLSQREADLLRHYTPEGVRQFAAVAGSPLDSPDKPACSSSAMQRRTWRRFRPKRCRLDVVEVGGAGSGHTVVAHQNDFGRDVADRGGHRSDGDLRQELQGGGAGQDDDRALLVRTTEPIPAYVSTLDQSGHACSCSQSPSSPPRTGRRSQPRRWRSSSASTRNRSSASVSALRVKADLVVPSRRAAPSTASTSAWSSVI